MMKLFVYGTLMSGMYNHFLLGSTKEGEQDEVTGFDLISCGSYPAMVRGTGTVKGEVYEVELCRFLTIQKMEFLYGYLMIEVKTKNNHLAFAFIMGEVEPSAIRLAGGDWRRFVQYI